MARVLIVHSGRTSLFPQRDCRLLAARHDVQAAGFERVADLSALRSKLRWADVVLLWFVGRAAMWSMLPPPRRPKIVSLVGGYEAARRGDLNYGSARSAMRRRLVRHICTRSHRIVTVSEFTKSELQRNLGISPQRVRVIPNAIHTGYFVPAAGPRDHALVLTVGHLDKTLVRIKGLDILLATARLAPEMEFVVVGSLQDREARRLVRGAPANVEFAGGHTTDALVKFYQRASVYFQPSRYESFGVALIEAMSCGCVPVVSPHGALPEVVGDGGYVLDRLDAEHAASVLRQALNAPAAARERARARVVEHFDIPQRAEKLFRLIDELLHEGNAAP